MDLADIAAKHTKLNKIEKLKQIRRCKEAWEALGEYAKKGYEAIPKEDRDFFLRCFGIFYRPATPGTFMMRIRISGGRLRSDQAILIGKMAQEYGEDRIDLTTRAEVQLRHLRIEHIPTILSSLEEVGLTSWQTGVDNFRNIVTDPLNAIAYDSVIDTSWLLSQMQELWLKKEEWIGTLPRKFNTAIGGTMSNRCNLFSHDCSFALAVKEGEYGFNVYLGGRVGTPATAADIFLSKEEVLPFYEALISIYRKYGFRDSRTRNRLHFLIKEAGMVRVVEAIKQWSKREFSPAGKTLVKEPPTEEKDGKIALKDGTYAVQMAIPAGLFSGTSMIETASLAKEYGQQELALSTTQNIFILGVPKKSIERMLKRKPYDRYSSAPGAYFAHLVSCTGRGLCIYGMIPGKPEAVKMSDFLNKEMPLPSDAVVRIHWSACLKGCGVHGFADIGLIGCKTKVQGEAVDAVHIQIGGKATLRQKEAYTILRSVPLMKARYYLKELMRNYRNLRRFQESFEEFESRVLQRYSKEAIAFLLRWNVDICSSYDLPLLSFEEEWKPQKERNEIFAFGERIYALLTKEKFCESDLQRDALAEIICKKNGKISPQIADVIEKMVASSPNGYENFSQLFEKIEDIGKM